MPYVFDPVAWEDFDGNRYGMEHDERERVILPEIEDMWGVKVYMYDPENPEDNHQFWTWVHPDKDGNSPFQTWEEWEVFIGALAEGHGLEIA